MTEKQEKQIWQVLRPIVWIWLLFVSLWLWSLIWKLGKIIFDALVNLIEKFI